LDPKPDKQVLIDLIKIKMPYGKYQGRLLCDIPLHYLVWMNQKDAFPNGKIGFLLKNLLEIKTNELEPILWKLKELYK
jgi:uncharacterized protein (DUF3820 family)